MASRWGSAWLMGVGQLGKGGGVGSTVIRWDSMANRSRSAWLEEVGQNG